jgi:stage V sporulation protein AD
MVTDINNMGAAMAPAAADTIHQYFADTNDNINDFDLILTGDLGSIGSEALYSLLLRDGLDIKSRHNDCGLLIFDRTTQPEVNAGGSGCGCAGAVLASYIIPNMANGTLKKVLFAATGALMSPTSSLQGESIPGISHLIKLEA